MRRRKHLPAIGAAALLLAALAAGLLFYGRKPFRELEAADIAAASVTLMPPDVTLELDEAEMGTLAELLGGGTDHPAGPVLRGVRGAGRPVHRDVCRRHGDGCDGPTTRFSSSTARDTAPPMGPARR